MAKKKIELKDYLPTIYEELKKGVLLTSEADGFINTMTIGWGTIGIEWGKPVFIAYVRTGRKTHEMLLKHGEFTINIPLSKGHSKEIGYIGTHSGRDFDKIKELGLHLESGEKVFVPAIKEFPLTLECKVVYKQTQDLNALEESFKKAYYPVDKESIDTGANKDPHTAFYGEIVDAYIVE